jgi:signal transduction histidine kinase
MFDMTNEISLQKNTEELEVTIGENEVKLSIMGDTLRTVAHEWRQPLNNISLKAQDLLFSYKYADDIIKKEEAIPILESIQGNIAGLSDIISKFQSITELKSSKINSNVADIINRAISKSSVKKNFISGQYTEKVLLNTYPRELETAIVSILNNADEAISKLNNNEKKVIILNSYIAENKHNLIVEISNNGGNIQNNILNKIFDAYFSTKEEKNGVGLNLYISKNIIELHLDGKIEVLNKKNNIVTFTITLPIGI